MTRRHAAFDGPGPAGRHTRFLPIAAAIAMAIAVALLALRVWLPPVAIVTRSAEQNVLLVTIDTLRADALGSYGGRAATPHLDRLASEGRRYTFAHAHAVVTLPSHATILTGVYPFEHGVRDNSGFRLDPSRTTLAARLKAKGFATGAFVGGFPVHSQFGLGTGFDVYDQQFGEGAAPSDFTVPERPAPAVVAAARAWLERQPNRWFAWVHLFDPHAPYRPPEPFASRYAGDPYAGEVAATDAALGPLLDWVSERPGRPTLVIVTSDHGEALGDHGEQTHGLFAYESTLRVPLIVAQFGGHKPALLDRLRRSAIGSATDAPARHVDIVPTVLDLLEIPPTPELEGRSLFAAQRPAPSSYFEALSASLNRGWAPLTGVVLDRTKYISLPLSELYDLPVDPGERHNLADVRPDWARKLEVLVRSFADRAAASRRREEDPATTARLRSLGYVTGRAEPKARYSVDDDPKRLVEVDRAIHEAIDLFERGKPAEATAIDRALVKSRPGMTLAYKHLAFLEWETGQRDAAITTLHAALAAGAGDAEVEARLGAYLSEEGRSNEALEHLQRAAASDGADIDTLNLLAIGYARAARSAEAVATFRRILAIDPNNAMAWQNIGASELREGRLDAAREAFERAVAADPRWSAAYTGLGAVRLRLGDRDGAIAYWKTAVDLDRANFDALFNLSTELVNVRRYTEARPYLRRFVAEAPPADYPSEIRRIASLLHRLEQINLPPR